MDEFLNFVDTYFFYSEKACLRGEKGTYNPIRFTFKTVELQKKHEHQLLNFVKKYGGNSEIEYYVGSTYKEINKEFSEEIQNFRKNVNVIENKLKDLKNKFVEDAKNICLGFKYEREFTVNNIFKDFYDEIEIPDEFCIIKKHMDYFNCKCDTQSELLSLNN